MKLEKLNELLKSPDVIDFSKSSKNVMQQIVTTACDIGKKTLLWDAAAFLLAPTPEYAVEAVLVNTTFMLTSQLYYLAQKQLGINPKILPCVITGLAVTILTVNFIQGQTTDQSAGVVFKAVLMPTLLSLPFIAIYFARQMAREA